MTGALTYGAAAGDNILLVKGSNGQTPVGTQANFPMIVRVVASDGVTPIAGATIGWSATNSAVLSVCGGATSCRGATDASGIASTAITPTKTGTTTITATLAPGIYSTTKSAVGTLAATSSSSDIGVTTPFLWIAQGASLSVPMTAHVVGDGVARSGVGVNFAIAVGKGSLSATSATTDSSGNATVNLALTNFASLVQVTACVAPLDNPCQNFSVNPVAASTLKLQPVAGTAQAITLDHAFQPLTVRVIDSASPPDPVLGASVAFQSTVMRTGGTASGNPGMPVILSVTQATVQSDVNGIATLLPSVDSFTGSLAVDIQAATGSASLDYVLQALPPLGSGTGLFATTPPRGAPVPVSPLRRTLRIGNAEECSILLSLD